LDRQRNSFIQKHEKNKVETPTFVFADCLTEQEPGEIALKKKPRVEVRECSGLMKPSESNENAKNNILVEQIFFQQVL